jgi:hypothetical protein
MPSEGFMTAFVKGLGLNERQARELLGLYMREKPELVELARLWNPTEGSKTRTEGFVEELVGLFDLTGWGDMQEAGAADLAQRSPEELAREFGRTAKLLRELEHTGESSLGYGGYLVLGEARKVAEIAQHICEGVPNR